MPDPMALVIWRFAVTTRNRLALGAVSYRPRILPDVPWGDSWAKAPNASKTQNRPQPLDNHGPGFNGLGFDGQDGSSNNGEAGLRIVGGS